MLKKEKDGSFDILQHLCGAKNIAKTFGVSRKTVAVWKTKGAPIVVVGKKLQANYLELWNWLKCNFADF